MLDRLFCCVSNGYGSYIPDSVDLCLFGIAHELMAWHNRHEQELHDYGTHCSDPYTLTEVAYLPLGPASGLDETQNRRTASFHPDMAYPMLRFLKESNGYHRGSTGHDPGVLETIFDDLYPQKDDRGEVWYHAAQWLTRQVHPDSHRIPSLES